MNVSLKLRTSLILGIVGAALIFLMSACAGNPGETAAISPSSQESTGEEQVIIENMGEKLMFTEPPKRAVTLNQHATEVMLALGLEQYMVGTAYLDDQILPEYKKQYDSIPVLSEEYPSQEVFYSANPDFAYAGWTSAFTEKTLGSRAELAEQGVYTYVQESSNKPSPSLENVYQDILNIGRIFRVEERSQALVDEMQREVEQIQDSIGTVSEPIKVFVYDSGEDTAFTAANTYLTSLINVAGGKNIFDDIEKSWATVSWEEIVNRNPDVIVIVDYGSTSVEEKKALLLGKAALADVTAIKNKHFVVLPLSAAAEGIRAPMALSTLASGFYPDKTKEIK
ncbi:ABC transporter substrate-binding protein [Paenibacillus sp. P96]|uniref:ABC transporter substrate-binding protein n=1 Tax=Paenibacillus zeirhizosphaerae TaxID=2987519 RepID=A0ABT9FQS2_9BACL|nr:ABC transporter substrate-binding protein [Paenibacillus sp. P96]MDP4097087.1 ABC transporter substrate-binding protein [Paenibacillus sp. P96]